MEIEEITDEGILEQQIKEQALHVSALVPLVKSMVKEVFDAREEDDQPSRTQTDILMEIANTDVQYRKNASGTMFATFSLNTKNQTQPVLSEGFEGYLHEQYMWKMKHHVKNNIVNDVTKKLVRMKRNYCDLVITAPRKLSYEDKIYINLGDDQMVEIDPEGWRVLPQGSIQAICFTEHDGQFSLPKPIYTGHESDQLQGLKRFINLGDNEDNYKMFVAWLLMALNPDPDADQPIVNCAGLQGTGKSFLTTMACKLVDPNEVTKMSLPESERAAVSLCNSRLILPVDNLTKISEFWSNALCRMASGGGMGGRSLYTNWEATSRTVLNPVIINGISPLIVKGDMARRSLLIKLEPIKRKLPKRQVRKIFSALHPLILGKLFSILSDSLRYVDEVNLDEYTSLPDFEAWIYAAEHGQHLKWNPGDFQKVYRKNQQLLSEIITSTDPVGIAILSYLADFDLIGTPSYCFEILKQLDGGSFKKIKEWPADISAFGKRITALTPNLEDAGLIVVRGRKDGERWLEIKKENRTG
jgi:hypothetical protein